MPASLRSLGLVRGLAAKEPGQASTGTATSWGYLSEVNSQPLSLGGRSILLRDALRLKGRRVVVDTKRVIGLLAGTTEEPVAGVGSPAWFKERAQSAAAARHRRPGGSREKQERIRAIWASGKYTTRDRCAEEEYLALGMSFSTARKALKNTPDGSGLASERVCQGSDLSPFQRPK